MTQQHRSDSRILDARTLADDFPALAARLRPGLRVLDVGCGTGAMTEGIAARVGSLGRVVGIDRDADLIARAAGRAPGMPWLRFERRDALGLEDEGQFDVVAVARTLQWIEADALPAAVSRLAMALAPGGQLIALDYNHRAHRWQPDPPRSLASFMHRFCAWREQKGWHSDVLPIVAALCADARLVVVALEEADDVVRRGDPRFPAVSAVWPQVIAKLGPQMAADGALGEDDRAEAEASAGPWCDSEMIEQRMAVRVLVAARVEE
jgi:ubiquinone/menaquinone biosynthesis C-methylase UbiE